jgi:hypothetical protein
MQEPTMKLVNLILTKEYYNQQSISVKHALHYVKIT